MKKTIIWGAGYYFKKNIDLISKINGEINICTNNPNNWGTYINGYKCISPEELYSEKDSQVIICLKRSEDIDAISKQLDENGITDYRYIDYLIDRDAIEKLKKLQEKRKKHNLIRVGFIVSDISVWDKESSIYENAKRDSRFETFLLCVPDIYSKDSSYVYEILKNQYIEAIDLREGNGPWNPLSGEGDWKDLKQYDLDYIFFSCPYDDYMPKKYHSDVVSEYTKICITDYGICTSVNFIDSPLNKDFFRYVYTFYAPNLFERDFNIERFKETHDTGIQRSVCYGYPVLQLFNNKQKKSDDTKWLFSDNNFRIIWTPRWTEQEELGGSNFKRYYKKIVEYAEKNENIDVLIRPHPLTFSNFVKTGSMSYQEISDFINKCKMTANICLDDSSEYIGTFENSSVLLTDYSTVIVEYFYTGKPIIYCLTKNPSLKYFDWFKNIIDTCYIAKDFCDVKKYIEMIKNGEDPLKQKRLQLCKELFPEKPEKIISDIIDDIWNDYNNS